MHHVHLGRRGLYQTRIKHRPQGQREDPHEGGGELQGCKSVNQKKYNNKIGKKKFLIRSVLVIKTYRI